MKRHPMSRKNCIVCHGEGYLPDEEFCTPEYNYGLCPSCGFDYTRLNDDIRMLNGRQY